MPSLIFLRGLPGVAAAEAASGIEARVAPESAVDVRNWRRESFIVCVSRTLGGCSTKESEKLRRLFQWNEAMPYDAPGQTIQVQNKASSGESVSKMQCRLQLSRRDIMKIARRFNAGTVVDKIPVPKGRLN